LRETWWWWGVLGKQKRRFVEKTSRKIREIKEKILTF